MNNENNIPDVQEVENDSIKEKFNISTETKETTQSMWDYYNRIVATEPDHRNHTGSRITPSNKKARKARRARRVQSKSRQINRK